MLRTFLFGTTWQSGPRQLIRKCLSRANCSCRYRDDDRADPRDGHITLRNDRDECAARECWKRRISTKAQGRSYHGVARLNCREIRSMVSTAGATRRQAGDRQYIVVDTDMAGLPLHADIFNTLPQESTAKNSLSNKSVWRKERQRLLDMANRNVLRAHHFRGGSLVE
jgi:hypothetical protein